MDDFEFVAGQADEGARLDVFAAQSLGASRSAVQRYIEDGYIQVNLRNVPKRYVLRAGDVVVCGIPPLVEYEAEPEDIPLDIVYEDADIVVVNKAQGMVVHPAAGHYSGTLVNALLYHCRDLSGVNGVMRPGIVHRLDKDTSGLIVAAKHDRAHHGLAAQLAERTMGRVYNAVAHGAVKWDSLRVETNIGRHPVDRKKMAVLPDGKGKRAVTHFSVVERGRARSLIEAKLETGRTHQIRVHLAHVGHPVVGDGVYGRQGGKRGQLLHARCLRLRHPVTGEVMSFETGLPWGGVL